MLRWHCDTQPAREPQRAPLPRVREDAAILRSVWAARTGTTQKGRSASAPATCERTHPDLGSLVDIRSRAQVRRDPA